MIYLDAAATTKPKQEIIEAMMPYFTEKWYNPSALYNKSNQIKKDIENARNIVGNFINANGNEIYFTSGGSESNCWAIQGFTKQCYSVGWQPIIITSTIEHKSINACLDDIRSCNFGIVNLIPVDKCGFVDVEFLEDTLKYYNGNPNVLVSMQFANNEIGTIQHIKEIAEITHRYGAIFHVDAVQAFGHIPIDVKELDIDMMSVSGHKIGCPKGIGFLYIKNSIKIKPLIYGSQMNNMRGGTENVPYIIGMAKAVELIQNDMTRFPLSYYRNYFISELKKLGCTVNGSMDSRLPNNINVTFLQDITGEAMTYMLDMCGIYVATGSACNSRSVESSHVLKAIGLSDNEAARSIRITLPNDISMEVIDKVISEITKQIMLLTSEE